MNMIFCGMPMCGKTTIGQRVSLQLGWSFIDNDRLIEKAYLERSGASLTCRQIFQKEGNAFFRALEKQQIHSLQGEMKAVIAVGGGSLCDADNRQLLKSVGSLIYLKASINVLWERTRVRGIHAYLDPEDPRKSFEEMAQRRLPIYEAAADAVIETDHLSIEEIVCISLKLRVENA